MTQAEVPFSHLVPLANEIALQNYPAATLYVIATPIGNIGDISLRALHVLSLADVVACEDTRHTAQLLSRYGLSKQLIAAHQHNEREIAEKLIIRLQAGERVALVSDAGTPAISDPGARIVDAVRSAGLRVVPLPGPSAAIAALSVSGLINDSFHFVGFLPAKTSQRDHALEQLRHIEATQVFYEAPHRIIETINALTNLFEPTRQLIIVREVTKLFEEIHRCPLQQAASWVAADSNRSRGEFVLVLEGASKDEDDDAKSDQVLAILLSECSVSQAASLAAKITGKKKNEMYTRALEMKKSSSS